jgi:hypothetical protein
MARSITIVYSGDHSSPGFSSASKKRKGNRYNSSSDVDNRPGFTTRLSHPESQRAATG